MSADFIDFTEIYDKLSSFLDPILAKFMWILMSDGLASKISF